GAHLGDHSLLAAVGDLELFARRRWETSWNGHDGSLVSNLSGGCPQPLDQVVAHAQRVVHSDERRAHRPDAGQQPGVEDARLVRADDDVVDLRLRRLSFGIVPGILVVGHEISSIPSLKMMRLAASINAKWEKACGKFPR